MPVPSQDKVEGLQQEGHPAYKWGNDGGGSLISQDRVVPSWMVGVSASVIFRYAIEVQKMISSGTSSPGKSQGKGS